MRHALPATLFLALCTAGCGAAGSVADDVDGDDQAGAIAPGTAVALSPDGDLTGEVRVRAGDLTLWVNAYATPGLQNGRRVWRIHGHTSRNLDHVLSYVSDDLFGEASVVGPRTFEVVLHDQDNSELVSTLLGVPLFLQIETTTGSRHHSAALWLGARLGRLGGEAGVSPGRQLAPVYVADGARNLRFRGRFTSTRNIATARVATADGAEPAVTIVAPRTARVDWTYQQLVDAADPVTDVTRFTVEASGRSFTATAGVDVGVLSIGLTDQTPEALWPRPTCTARIGRCLDALPAGTTDYSACGAYWPVRTCMDARAAGVGLCGASLQQAVETAVAGLLWPSESDRPVTYVSYPGAGSAPVTAAQLLSLTGQAADTAVEERTFEDTFAWFTRDDPNMDDYERMLAVQFRALRSVLERNLTDVKVYKTGKIQVGLYIVGRTRCGEWAGVTTILIET